jgi:hypothetical protein
MNVAHELGNGTIATYPKLSTSHAQSEASERTTVSYLLPYTGDETLVMRNDDDAPIPSVDSSH